MPSPTFLKGPAVAVGIAVLGLAVTWGATQATNRVQDERLNKLDMAVAHKVSRDEHEKDMLRGRERLDEIQRSLVDIKKTQVRQGELMAGMKVSLENLERLYRDLKKDK